MPRCRRYMFGHPPALLHILAGLSIDELDQPALDHIERRIPLGMLIEHLPRLEAPPRPSLGQPLELAVRKPREQNLISQVGEPLASNHLLRRHTFRLPSTRSEPQRFCAAMLCVSAVKAGCHGVSVAPVRLSLRWCVGRSATSTR